MPHDDVLVSVLIPVRNEERHLPSFSRALLDQRLDGEAEFLFVDGASTDHTPEILAELARRDPRVRVLDNPARRTPNALNIGLAAARGEYVARMDAHTRYPSSYLATGIDRLRSRAAEGVVWASGPQRAEGDGRWSRRVAAALDGWLGTGGARFRRAETEQDVDSGFTGVWRRQTLTELGGWDEGWPINQDAELAARIHARGGRIVCTPEMAASYVPRDGLGPLARQYARYGHYRAKTARRHPHSMRPGHLLSPALTLCASAALAAPRPLAVPARGCLAFYLAVVASAAALKARRLPIADAGGVAMALTTMHLAWGAGFLSGCVRFGPPVAAMLGLGRHAVAAVSASARGRK